MYILAEYFAETAKKYNLKIESCAEQIDLEQFGIHHGKCIDDELIEKITGYKITAPKDNQRAQCGCIKCIDIGEYNTCLHKCKYCYASADFDKCDENYLKHDPKSPLLIGWPNGNEKIIEMKPKLLNTYQIKLNL